MLLIAFVLITPACKKGKEPNEPKSQTVTNISGSTELPRFDSQPAAVTPEPITPKPQSKFLPIWLMGNESKEAVYQKYGEPNQTRDDFGAIKWWYRDNIIGVEIDFFQVVFAPANTPRYVERASWTPTSGTFLKCGEVLSSDLLQVLKTKKQPKVKPPSEYPTQFGEEDSTTKDYNRGVAQSFKNFTLEWVIDRHRLTISGSADHPLIETIQKFEIESGQKRTFNDWIKGQKEWLLSHWGQCRLTKVAIWYKR